MTEHWRATLRGKESFIEIIEFVVKLSRAAQYFALSDTVKKKLRLKFSASRYGILTVLAGRAACVRVKTCASPLVSLS